MNTDNPDTGILAPIVAVLAFGTIGALIVTIIVAGANAVQSTVVWLQ